MSGGQNILWTRLQSLRLAGQGAVVIGVAVVAWLIVAPVAYAVSGTPGVIVAAVAAMVCVAGAELALVIGALFRGPAAAMHAMVIGMLTRMLFPLGLGTALILSVAALADGGMIYYLLIFYLITLATETVLLLAQVSANPSSQKSIHSP